MKFFLIAGEASGDLHGSNLIKAIKDKDPEAEFRFHGGELMASRADGLFLHYKDTALMGLTDVIANIGKVFRGLSKCRDEINRFRPDVIILIDYAGFNLRIAKWAKKAGYRVFYYISPKIWAWRQSRVEQVKKFVDYMFVILPFEVDFYKDHGFKSVEYVGNPVADAVRNRLPLLPDWETFLRNNQLEDKPVVALLAGSRRQEIRLCLPEMLGAAGKFDGYQFVIAGAPGIEKEFYNTYMTGHNVKIVYNQTYELVKNAVAAIVVSGTATLETALLGTPEIVIYKTSKLTYEVGRRFVNIKFFSLVNLFLGREAVKELLQFDIQEKIVDGLDKLLHDAGTRNKMLDDYRELQEIIGHHDVSDRSASSIIHKLKTR